MFETLFGAEMPLTIRFLLGFLIVLGVVGAGGWAMRRFGTGRQGGASSHGRQPRLALGDSVSVDGRRRLILLRRDDVEHLLMIGGPTDVVVEPNIVRAGAAPHEAPVGRLPGAAEPLPRALLWLDKGSRPLVPEATPRPALRIEPLPEEPAARPVRSHAEKSTRFQRDTLAALADELSAHPPVPRVSPTTVARPHSTEPRPALRPTPQVEPRPEPRIATPPQPVAAQPAAAETKSTADENLADMAHRLIAALRKPDATSSPARTPSEPKPPRADAKPNQSTPRLGER